MKNYCIVKSLDLAKAIVFVTGEQYYIYDDLKGDGKVYSFKNTVKFQKAMDYLNNLKEELIKI